MRNMAFRRFRIFLLCQVIAICGLPVRARSAAEQRNKRSNDMPPLQVVVDNLVQEVNSLKAQLTAEQTAREAKEAAIEYKLNTYATVVAFHASSTSDITVAPYGTVVIPHVETNIGNAYDPQTGFFTAPVSGIYMFHATFMDNDQMSFTHAGIYVGEHQFTASISDSHHGAWDNPGLAAIAHVIAGQKVQLRSNNDVVDHFYTRQYTTFSGFLIRAD